MIKINGLTKKYGDTKALNNIDMTIEKGQIIGLFGENGAGKTTLMKCILSFLNYEGEILMNDEVVTHKNIANISFATCEHSFFANLTPRDHMEFYKSHFEKFNQKRFDALIDFFNLPMDKRIKSMSTGQKNQFEVILSLCQGANFILMDEPFAGNDIFNREDFYKVLLGILKPNETVILSTHLLEEVQHFISRAVLISRGEIIADVEMLDLEENGQSLIDFVKQTYNYRADRVSKALDELTD